MVGQIRRRAKTKSIDFSFAMDQSYRLKLRPKQFKAPFHRAHFDLGQSSKFVIRIKDVSEHVLNERGRVRMRIERKPVGFVAETQWAQVVDTQNVVSVRMRVQHRIKLANPLTDCLLAKIRSGVDHDTVPAVLDQN